MNVKFESYKKIPLMNVTFKSYHKILLMNVRFGNIRKFLENHEKIHLKRQYNCVV